MIDLRVFHKDIHEHRALGGNLWSDFQLQHRVDELHGNGVVDGGLNRNLGALLDGGLFVVLRDHARLGQQFANAFRFRRGDEEVHGEVRRAMPEEESAGGGGRS